MPHAAWVPPPMPADFSKTPEEFSKLLLSGAWSRSSTWQDVSFLFTFCFLSL